MILIPSSFQAAAVFKKHRFFLVCKQWALGNMKSRTRQKFMPLFFSEIYRNSQWSLVAARLPTSRLGLRASTVQNSVYVSGK